jgi:hypothetical protein
MQRLLIEGEQIQEGKPGASHLTNAKLVPPFTNRGRRKQFGRYNRGQMDVLWFIGPRRFTVATDNTAQANSGPENITRKWMEKL